jgi:hypothetical protein
MTERFKEFCSINNYRFENFSEQAVLHFVLQLDSEDVSVSTLGQIKPALTKNQRGSSGGATGRNSEAVSGICEAVQGRRGESRPIQPEDSNESCDSQVHILQIQLLTN